MRIYKQAMVMLLAACCAAGAFAQTAETQTPAEPAPIEEGEPAADENVIVRGDGRELPIPGDAPRRRFEGRQGRKCALRAQDQADPMRPQLETPEEVCER